MKKARFEYQMINGHFLKAYEDAILHNDAILDTILETVNEETPHIISFKSSVQTHSSLLKQNLKYSEIFADAKVYEQT